MPLGGQSGGTEGHGTGGVGGAKTDKDKNKDKKGLAGGGTGISSQERNLNALDSLRGGKAQDLDPATGKGLGPKGEATSKKPMDGIIPGVSKRQRSTTKTRPLTGQNLLTGALSALGMGPMTAIGMIAGSEEVTGVEGGLLSDIGLGYEGPVGMGTDAETDSTQTKANMGDNTSTASEFSPQTKNKKKNNPLGTVGTLLADAGGTLVAG
jgi:hypothetical protein